MSSYMSCSQCIPVYELIILIFIDIEIIIEYRKTVAGRLGGK